MHSGKLNFLAIYGRRRVGKTFTIRDFFKNYQVFYLNSQKYLHTPELIFLSFSVSVTIGIMKDPGLCLIVPSIHYNERSLPGMVAFEKDVDFFSDIPEKEKESFEMLHAVQTKEKWGIYRKRILPAVKIADQTLLERVIGKLFTFPVDELSQPFDKPALILL